MERSISGGSQQRPRPSNRLTTDGETLSLALFFYRATTLDPALLLLEIGTLLVQVFFHLAVTGVQLFLALLELLLLLRDLLLEHHPHLALHLLQLLFVERPLLFLLGGWVDLAEYSRV